MADKYEELNNKINNLTNLVAQLLESAKNNQNNLLNNLPLKKINMDNNQEDNKPNISGKAYSDVVAEGQATVNYTSTNNYFIIVK